MECFDLRLKFKGNCRINSEINIVFHCLISRPLYLVAVNKTASSLSTGGRSSLNGNGKIF